MMKKGKAIASKALGNGSHGELLRGSTNIWASKHFVWKEENGSWFNVLF